MTVKYLAKKDVLSVKKTDVPLFYSASGYGRAIPTQYMVQLRDKRWRRVYVCCFSNAGTAYIKTKDDAFTVVGPEAQELLDRA